MVAARTWVALGFLLVFVSSLITVFFGSLVRAFLVSPYLNGFIVLILLVGAGYSLVQLFRMGQAGKWLNAHRGFETFGFPRSSMPVLLGDLGAEIDEGHGHFDPTYSQAQNVCDKVVTRVESGRDINRYIMGSLIFLGLLGTFWGLSLTVNGIMETVSNLHIANSDPAVAFEQIKAGLSGPLSGMGTAFTSSLFGLAGFVIFGFVELLVNTSRRRFVNMFESWISQFVAQSKAPLKALPHEGDQDMPYSMAVLSAMVESLESLNNALVKENDHNRSLKENIGALADRMGSLTEQVRTEQMLMMKLAEGQIALQHSLQKLNESALSGELGFDKASRGHIRTMSRAVAQLSEMLSGGELTKDIKQELRILSKTIGISGAGNKPASVVAGIESASVDHGSKAVGTPGESARREWEERRGAVAGEPSARTKLSALFKG